MFRSILTSIVTACTRVAANFRISYLPPAMVYFAAGVSGLTGIVGTFFVKDYLGLSAAFLASLGFWAGVPWTLKIPLGHLVDIYWRFKGWLVLLGAAVIACSLAIMVGLIGSPEYMNTYMSSERWFVIAVLLSPIGYVIQDVVADAMTIEAVPRYHSDGSSRADADKEADHKTMQTIGRGALIFGTISVALLNVIVFRDVDSLQGEALTDAYLSVYHMAFAIPLVSVAGIALHTIFKWVGMAPQESVRPVVQANKVVLGISAAYVSIAIGVGLQTWKYKEEILFTISAVLIVTLLLHYRNHFTAAQRRTFYTVATVIFIFRAMPGVGAGYSWFVIDTLDFDQGFIAKLSLVGSLIAFSGIFLYRAYFARKPILSIYKFLTVIGTLMGLPNLGLYYGAHLWTARMTNGAVDAKTIALIDTAAESPLGNVSMLPMLSFIASSAPEGVEATFFAVVASLSNLALSASAIFTKHLNTLYVVTREVTDSTTGEVITAADYSQLGPLMITSLLIGLLVPMAAIWAGEQILGPHHKA